MLMGTVAVVGAQKPPQLVIESMSGHDLYQFYCATCHGRDGKGDGPVAAVLKTKPADLTTIAARNDGLFPRARVLAFIATSNPAVAAHGSADMPVWGPIFQGLDNSKMRTEIRLDNLVSYIESMQKK
jgi:mono/diheme cytochrome c family protein